MAGFEVSELPIMGVEFLCSAVPFAVFYLIAGKKHGTKNKGTLLLFLFAAYIIGVFHFTGAGTVWEAIRYQDLNEVWEAINLIPFSSEIDVAGYMLNMVLFVPFGFFVPLIWRKRKRVRDILAGSLMFSVLIEASQLLNHRRTDVDDLIMNTVGGILGYVLFRVIRRIFGDKEECSVSAAAGPVMVIAIIFFGRFLFFNEVWLALRVFNY